MNYLSQIHTGLMLILKGFAYFNPFYKPYNPSINPTVKTTTHQPNPLTINKQRTYVRNETDTTTTKSKPTVDNHPVKSITLSKQLMQQCDAIETLHVHILDQSEPHNGHKFFEIKTNIFDRHQNPISLYAYTNDQQNMITIDDQGVITRDLKNSKQTIDLDTHQLKLVGIDLHNHHLISENKINHFGTALNQFIQILANLEDHLVAF